MITATHVRRAAQLSLQTYLAAHIEAAAADPDLAMTDQLPNPRVATWLRLPDFAALDPTQSPAIIVTSPGLTDEPDREAEEGLYRATWDVLVHCVVRATTYEAVADLVGLYVGAIRECLLQRRLAGLRASMEWVDEGYNELDTDDARSIGAGRVWFRAVLADVVSDQTPVAAPDGAAVDSVIVTTSVE